MRYTIFFLFVFGLFFTDIAVATDNSDAKQRLAATSSCSSPQVIACCSFKDSERAYCADGSLGAKGLLSEANNSDKKGQVPQNVKESMLGDLGFWKLMGGTAVVAGGVGLVTKSARKACMAAAAGSAITTFLTYKHYSACKKARFNEAQEIGPNSCIQEKQNQADLKAQLIAGVVATTGATACAVLLKDKKDKNDGNSNNKGPELSGEDYTSTDGDDIPSIISQPSETTYNTSPTDPSVTSSAPVLTKATPSNSGSGSSSSLSPGSLGDGLGSLNQKADSPNSASDEGVDRDLGSVGSYSGVQSSKRSSQGRNSGTSRSFSSTSFSNSFPSKKPKRLHKSQFIKGYPEDIADRPHESIFDLSHSILRKVCKNGQLKDCSVSSKGKK